MGNGIFSKNADPLFIAGPSSLHPSRRKTRIVLRGEDKTKYRGAMDKLVCPCRPFLLPRAGQKCPASILVGGRTFLSDTYFFFHEKEKVSKKKAYLRLRRAA